MIKERYVLKESVKKSIKQMLETIIILLIGMIAIKINPIMAKTIDKEVYKDSFSFQKINNISKKYLGSFIPKIVDTTQPVFNEKQLYSQKKDIENGIELTVNNNPISVLESGMVMQINSNSITIEQVDGVKATYNNIILNNYKLYDYLEKGDILGLPVSEKITIIFTKEGEKVDYQKYI